MIQKHTFQTKIIKYFLGVMFIIYPLFFHDFFYNIVTCKFIVFISVTALFLFIYLMTGKDEHSDTIPWYRKLCWSDYFIIALFCIQLISVLFSYDRLTSFIGTDGRNAGIVTILCYLILYVILS